MLKIQIINGPNLNLTGKRQPEVYGLKSFDDLQKDLNQRYSQLECSIFQSNHEGEIIDCIQSAQKESNAIIINAGGFTHTSVAIADALESITIPIVEVHISNILGREEFRQKSFTAPHAIGVISGFGLDGYLMAIDQLQKVLNEN